MARIIIDRVPFPEGEGVIEIWTDHIGWFLYFTQPITFSIVGCALYGNDNEDALVRVFGRSQSLPETTLLATCLNYIASVLKGGNI